MNHYPLFAQAQLVSVASILSVDNCSKHRLSGFLRLLV